MTNLAKHLMDVRVAAGWNELAPRQFARIGDHLHRYGGVALKANITWTLLDMSWRTPRKLAGFFFGINAEGRHRMTRLADPFLDPKGLTDTLLPTLQAGGTTLHCCHPDLLNQLDVETWGIADAFYMRYGKTRDIQHLQHMAAVLYAPLGTTREQRMHPNNLDLYYKVNTGPLMALHLMWSGHRKVLVEEAPWVFRATNQKRAARRRSGWGDVIRSLSGTKFGPYDTTCRTPVRVFLRELSDAMELDAKRREQAEKAKRR